MNVEYLGKLNEAASFLLRQKNIIDRIEELKTEVPEAKEAFVWSALDLNSLLIELPERIKSGWIFVLKKNVPSGCHYHPNSIQHMIVIEGQGESQIADIRKRLIPYSAPDCSLNEKWSVIDQGVPHEFFPVEKDMVVISFHTCEAHELEEVDCQTGKRRFYEEEM